MKKTEIVFILDKSGSMSGLEEDTIGGYNGMLKRQQKLEGDLIVTTVLFDDNYEIIHDRTNIKEIKPLTEQEYFVGGTTALLDAVGRAIVKTINANKNIKLEFQADKVMFVIITDGMENASLEYSYDKIKNMIEKQKTEHNWEFIFLGANIDSISTASKFGIDEDRSANYNADSEGTELNYGVISDAIVELRQESKISSDWKENIEKDYKSRSGR